VLTLNDHGTSYPFACPEGSIIGATRTVASAALAAHGVRLVGTGLIARDIHAFPAGTGWAFDEIGVFDLSAESAAGLRGHLERSGGRPLRMSDTCPGCGWFRDRALRGPIGCRFGSASVVAELVEHFMKLAMRGAADEPGIRHDEPHRQRQGAVCVRRAAPCLAVVPVAQPSPVR
jgi:hypothetical protein